MTKFRLLNTHRGRLEKFARSSLVCSREAAAETVAFEHLSVVVGIMLRTICSEHDMAVLRRHHATRHVGHLQVRAPGLTKDLRYLDIYLSPRDPSLGPYYVAETRLERNVEVPAWLAEKGNRPALHTNELPPEMATDLIQRHDAWVKAAVAHDEAREEILRATYFLIDNSRTLEALIEKWPVAEGARELLGAKLLPVAPDRSEQERIVARAVFVPPPAAPEAPAQSVGR